MQNARAAMRAFSRKRELCALSIELRPPCDQFLYTRRAFLNQHLGRFRV